MMIMAATPATCYPSYKESQHCTAGNLEQYKNYNQDLISLMSFTSI